MSTRGFGFNTDKSKVLFGIDYHPTFKASSQDTEANRMSTVQYFDIAEFSLLHIMFGNESIGWTGSSAPSVTPTIYDSITIHKDAIKTGNDTYEGNVTLYHDGYPVTVKIEYPVGNNHAIRLSTAGSTHEAAGKALIAYVFEFIN